MGKNAKKLIVMATLAVSGTLVGFGLGFLIVFLYRLL